jgi:hypothetical protein
MSVACGATPAEKNELTLAKIVICVNASVAHPCKSNPESNHIRTQKIKQQRVPPTLDKLRPTDSTCTKLRYKLRPHVHQVEVQIGRHTPVKLFCTSKHYASDANVPHSHQSTTHYLARVEWTPGYIGL